MKTVSITPATSGKALLQGVPKLVHRLVYYPAKKYPSQEPGDAIAQALQRCG